MDADITSLAGSGLPIKCSSSKLSCLLPLSLIFLHDGFSIFWDSVNIGIDGRLLSILRAGLVVSSLPTVLWDLIDFLDDEERGLHPEKYAIICQGTRNIRFRYRRIQ
jgi:hypothetical protein